MSDYGILQCRAKISSSLDSSSLIDLNMLEKFLNIHHPKQ